MAIYNIFVVCQFVGGMRKQALLKAIFYMTSWNGDQKTFTGKHRKSAQPRGYNSSRGCEGMPPCSAAHTITWMQLYGPLPAALSNTQVKKR